MNPLTTGQQKVLCYLVKHGHQLQSFEATSRHLATKTGYSTSFVTRALTRLGDEGFIEMVPGRGKRMSRVTKVLEKGLRYPFSPITSFRKGENSKVKLKGKVKGEMKGPGTNGTSRPWENTSVPPRPWEQKSGSEEELEKIRELVQPREGETVYEAVHALYQYACQK